MNTESAKVHRVERVDDIPVLLATLQRLKVAEILDRHFPSGHRWKGELTFGEVACVWIAFITSQGDHRLNQVEPWVAANIRTLQACLGKTVGDVGLVSLSTTDITGTFDSADVADGIGVQVAGLSLAGRPRTGRRPAWITR